MQNELYDVFYNGQFVCRIVDVLLKSFLALINDKLPFDGEQTSVVVRKFVPVQPEEQKEKAEEPTTKKA